MGKPKKNASPLAPPKTPKVPKPMAAPMPMPKTPKMGIASTPRVVNLNAGPMSPIKAPTKPKTPRGGNKGGTGGGTGPGSGNTGAGIY